MIIEIAILIEPSELRKALHNHMSIAIDTFTDNARHFCHWTEFGSHDLQKIAKVATYLKDNPATVVRIEGHCDHCGTTEHNLFLGDRRAHVVRTELLRRGIHPARVDAISFGKERPVDPGHGSAARKKNRRAEFVLLRPPVPEDPSVHNQTPRSTPR
jgi:hypothetical protein